jgi:predicted nucleotidyltransferase
MTDDTGSRATEFARLLAERTATALGAPALAVILHGSLVLGAFTPGRSDVDLLVVVAAPLTDTEIGALRGELDALRHDAPGRVDLRVVTRAVASAPTRAPPMEAYLSLRPGEPSALEARVAAEPDLVVEFAMVRAHGRALVGVDPRSVVGPVPDEWVVEVGDRQLAAWERLTDDAAHAELMVLTTCRIWRFSVEGVFSSKADAGRWALARDPSLTAVEQALRQCASDRRATIDEGGIRRLIARVRQEIAAR